MLTEVVDGVFVHESECIQSNSVIVQGDAGVLLIDPGLTRDELVTIADDVRAMGQIVVAGFSTHPDWDHALWHEAFGDVPRYGTTRAAASLAEFLTLPDWREQVAEGLPPEIADDVPMELFGLIAGVPSTTIPWEGPAIRILEHDGHARGHAALLIDDRGVLVAGDMLSNVLVPMPDLQAADPIADYLAGLALLEATGASVVIPGHGAVGRDLTARVALDRTYLEELRGGIQSHDPRIGAEAAPGWEWVVYIHEGNVERLVG